MKKQVYVFPAVFYFDPDGIAIEFPDLPGCLPCAHTAEEAFHNAREALGAHLYGMEQDGDPIPEPTSIHEIHPEDGGTVVLIDVFMPTIRSAQAHRSVSRTVSLPAWLNAAALEKNVNFSQVLQDALRQTLHISEP